MKLLTNNRPPKIITVTQAAKVLGVARQTVLWRIQRGDLTPVGTEPFAGRPRYLLSLKDVERLKRG